MANILTGLRIAFSAALLFCEALSPAFYALYLAAGVTDMADGTAARKTGTASAFGAMFDTVADFILFAACLVKTIPALDIPAWAYAWAAAIALTKAVNAVSGLVMKKRLVFLHTPANRVAGALLFLLPLTPSFMELKYSLIAVCAAATFAAAQEGHFIRTGRIPSGEARGRSEKTP